MMDSNRAEEQATESSDSSTGEPIAVRRRLDLDGSFTGLTRGQTDDGQQSPTPEGTRPGHTRCDDSLLDLNQDSVTDVDTNYYNDCRISLAEETNTSNKDADNINNFLRTPVTHSASSLTGYGQQENNVVVNHTSESSKKIEGSETSEKDINGGSEREVSGSHSSDSDSRSDGKNVSSPYGGSVYSLIELCTAYEKASRDLEWEKSIQEMLVNDIGTHLSRVSQLSCYFLSVANAPLGEFVAYVESLVLRPSSSRSGNDNIDALEEKLEVFKAYVSGVSTEAVEVVKREPIVSPMHLKQCASENGNLIESRGSGGSIDVLEPATYVRSNFFVRKAWNSVRKSRNVVVRQQKLMSKVCAVAELIVVKIEINLKMIRNILKSEAIVLTPAVRLCRLMEEAARNLAVQGHGLPAFAEGAYFAARWTGQALAEAEELVNKHKAAAEAMRAAWWDLDFMQSSSIRGADVSRNIIAAGDRFMELANRPDVCLDEIKKQERNLKLMRARLTPVLLQMRGFRKLIQERSDVCGDIVLSAVEMMNAVTENSCRAIEVATETVEHILIPSGVS